MAHGRKKAKNRVKKRTPVLMPKKPVVEGTKVDSKDMVCFLTYSVGCIALQKVVNEMLDYWTADDIKFVVFDQSVFENVLKNQLWKVVVLHRGATHGWNPEKTPQLMALLQNQKENGARLVYYIDDFLVHLNNNAPLHLMNMCDTVIAKGYFLPDYLSKSEGIKNVVPLKTWINLEKFDKVDMPIEFPKPLNVVWFSAGRTGLGFMPSLFEALNPDDWKDTEWHMVGSTIALFRAVLNKYRGFKKGYSEKIPIDNLQAIVKNCDVLINPLHPATDNMDLAQLPVHRVFFNNAKVEIKYIMAGAARKPLVTCRSRAYEECIKNGVNGFISDDPKEWADYLLQLRDEGLRLKIGEAARKDIEANYDAKDRWPIIKKYILGE